jgi:hypothetical protein
MLSIDARQTLSTKLIIVTIVVRHSSHGCLIRVSQAVELVALGEASHTGASASATTLALAMPSKGIASGETAVAFGADVRLLAGVELAMSLEVM